MTARRIALIAALVVAAGALGNGYGSARTIDRLNTLTDVAGDVGYEFGLCPNAPMMDLRGDTGILTFYCPGGAIVVHYSFKRDLMTLIGRAS